MLKASSLRALYLLFFALLLSNALFAEKLVVGTYDWCPYTCDPSINNGQRGYLVEIIDAVFEGSNYQLEYKVLPYARILKGLETGQIHLVSGATRDESIGLATPDFNQGYYSGGFFALEGSATYEGYQSLASSKSVAVITGYDYSSEPFNRLKQEFPKKIRYMTGEDLYKRMFQLLDAGRVDVLHEDIKALTFYAEKYGYGDKAKFWGGKTEDASVFVTFSPVAGPAVGALEFFNDRFAELVENGKIKEILIRYDIDPEEFNFNDS